MPLEAAAVARARLLSVADEGLQRDEASVSVTLSVVNNFPHIV